MRTRDWLSISAIIYLTLPYYLFFLGWLRIEVGVLSTVLLAVCVGAYIQKLPIKPSGYVIPWKSIAVIAGFAFLWVMISGITGYTYQRGDYIKHNLIFRDLIENSWPLIYQGGTYSQDFLCYYIAYYLPPSLLCKWTSIQYLPALMLLWGGGGLFLVFCWVYKFQTKHRLLGVLLFTLFGGMDFFYTLFEAISMDMGGLRHFLTHEDISISFSKTRLLYPSHANQINWVPQHAIGGWLVSALLYQSYQQKNIRYIGLIQAISLLWSTFVFIGLLPFSLYLVFKYWSKALFSWENLVSLTVVGLVGGSYFLAHYPLDYWGMLLHFPIEPIHLWKWFYFVMTEVGIYLLLLYSLRKYLPDWHERKPYYLIVAIVLLGLPFFEMGYYNDLVMRASIPAFFLLSLMLSQTLLTLYQTLRMQWPYRILLLCFCIGMFVPIKESLRWLAYNPAIQHAIPPPSYLFQDKQIKRMTDLHQHLLKKGKPLEADYVRQYMGKQDSFFGTYLIKTPQ